MTPKPRWFRFGLRTMFAVVTLFGLWLAIQVKWIRDRREFLRQDGIHFSSASHLFDGQPPENFEAPIFEPDVQTAPGLLWLFGEPAISELWIDFTLDSERNEQQFVEARRLFPEASVSRTPYF